MPSTLGIVASGEDVFNDAVLWLDTARSVAGETTMVNYGKGGSALNATYGSSAGADTNDPLLLTHSGTNYLYLPGVAGNYASTPDAAALDITGDMEVVMRMSCPDWSPTATGQIICKDNASAGGRSWGLDLLNNGGLRWVASAGGTAINVNVATSTFPGSTVLLNGGVYWLKVTFDVDNGASGNDVRFWYAADQPTEPTSWTQIGTTQTTAGVTSIANTATAVVLGDRTVSASPLQTSIYRAIVRNGIGGTTVFDADFTTGITSGGQTSFTCTTGQTVTINRATSGRKSVAVVRNVLLFGTDDYLEIADNDLLDFGASDSFTVMVSWREHATVPSFARYVSKMQTASPGWEFLHNSTISGRSYITITDGAATTDTSGRAGTYTQGSANTVVAVRNTAADTLLHYNNGVAAGSAATDTTTGTLANSATVRIGRASGAGANYADMELISVAVWRRALTTNEIATAVARYV